MNAKVPLWTLTLLALCSRANFSQGFDSLPVYKPQQHIAGTIRIRGDEHPSVMLRNWEKDFHRYQPDILFEDHLTSTVHGIPALVFDVADLGPLGREIAPLENLSFRRMFRYDPLEITIATGSYDTPYEAFALGVFVNKENPLSQLTLQQVAAIFGCGPGKKYPRLGSLRPSPIAPTPSAGRCTSISIAPWQASRSKDCRIPPIYSEPSRSGVRRSTEGLPAPARIYRQ